MAIALELYEALRSAGMDDAKAKSAADRLDEAFERRLTERLQHLATREDLAREIGQLRAELQAVRADLIKWMFVFWIGQFASIVGTITAILFAFFKP
ncbi:MAG: hypothetical protein HYY13_02415 [Nitrospirae bacterium]|nr:hypothetical protein [Nitrospirota bacterium]